MHTADKRPPALGWAGLVAIVVGLSGLLHLVVALFPPQQWQADQLENWTPFHIAMQSQGLLLVSGVGQLALGRGLWRRKRAAWLLAVAALIVTPLLHIGRDFEWTHAAASCVPLALLWWRRKNFIARSDQGSVRWAWIIGAPAFVALVIYGYLAVGHFAPQVAGDVTPLGRMQTVLELVFLQSTDTERAVTQQAQAVFYAVSFAGGVFGVLGVMLVLRPVFPRRTASPTDLLRARQIIDATGDNPFDEFAVAADKHLFFARSNRSFVAFALWRNYALTLCDPVGPAEERAEAAREFVAHCAEQDWEPVFYEIGPGMAPVYEELGFKVRKIGEQARLPLTTWTLIGRKFQDLRTACNRAAREGLVFRWYDAQPVDEALETGLRETSDAWLAAKRGREMTFDMGAFSVEEIRLRGAAVALDAQGRVQAFATWLPYRQGRARCIDLMRHRAAMPGLMDFVITESVKRFQAAGLEEACLANVPLANTAPPGAAGERAHDRAMRYVYENFNRLYGAKPLFEFKKKYQPEWRGSYLAFRHAGQLPAIACAMVSVHVPGGLWKLLRS